MDFYARIHKNEILTLKIESLIGNVVLVSGAQHRDPVMHIRIHFFFFPDSFPLKVILNYSVSFPVVYGGSLVIYFMYSSVCMLIPNLLIYSLLPFHFGHHKFVCVCGPISVS